MYKPQDLAIYIHWPFCKSKCPYCDFYKELASNCDEEKLINEYLEALKHYYKLLPEREIKSIFFGGGTPSLLKPQNIAKIIDCICGHWKIKNNIEISLEANPNSNHKNMFKDLKNAGINRLSLGVQALNEKDLKFLGRTHTLQEARESLQEIVQIFSNHSADLIYARPQQTQSEWQQELTEICAYGLKHLSLYQLTIEENTVFARKNIKVLNDETAADLYTHTREYLATKGYDLYEVSNFAQNGFESRHNCKYWRCVPYLGIGPSAHSCWNGKRFFVQRDLAAFLQDAVQIEQLEDAAPCTLSEQIMLGMRLRDGMPLSVFSDAQRVQLHRFAAMGLLRLQAQRVSFTPEGFLVSNAVLAALL